MQRFILSLLICAFTVEASASSIYERLDSALAAHSQAVKAKEDHIDRLKNILTYTSTDTTQLLAALSGIFHEYRYFRFDSAMAYAGRGLSLATEARNPHYIALFGIHQASVLSASGLYSEATDVLASIDSSRLDSNLKFEYYNTLYWLYTYWSDYCIDNAYRNSYWSLKKQYLQLAIDHAAHKPAHKLYLQAERELYVSHDHRAALNLYRQVLAAQPHDTRLYSAACFAAACCCESLGYKEMHEKLLVECAITDLSTPVMENLSLLTLARLLYSRDADMARAESYINAAIADAEFFGNRLRILHGTSSLSLIVDKYKAQLSKRNVSLQLTLAATVVCLLLLIATSVFIARQKCLLSRRKEEISCRNIQLEYLNKRLSQLNDRLTLSNEHLITTNARRENLAKIYIDLCSHFIDRFENYRKLVCRKIKAKQADDLLLHSTSCRLSDEDAEKFFAHFDKAFLDLYPSFVEDLNALLTPDAAISPEPGRLTPELRIFALIRLGVKESSEIANLLFYTPRTIYNYRSTVKSHARCKDSFEDDVRRIAL